MKFPARGEHAEVCAIEFIYADCLRRCGIQTPETRYFTLPNRHAAFASRRFDRQDGLQIPMQNLAAFTGANYQIPGTLDYANFLRATHKCTNDIREKTKAFKRMVFNVAFNNRDDHPKNFAYVMSRHGQWTLAPAYDVTYCEGPGGCHQMDIGGEALDVSRASVLHLADQETELTQEEASDIVTTACDVASRFSRIAAEILPTQVTPETLTWIQRRIDRNVRLLADV